MHLKQDTDYALRVVFYVGCRAAEQGRAFRGCGFSDVARAAGMPGVRVGRVCAGLERTGILLIRRDRGREPVCWPGVGFRSRTLLDVMRAVGDETRLLALFDRDSALFRARGDVLEETQAALERLLTGLTLDVLLRSRDGAAHGRW